MCNGVGSRGFGRVGLASAIGLIAGIGVGGLAWPRQAHAQRVLIAPEPSNPGKSAGKFYPNTSSVADAFLRNAQAHVRDAQWGEAIDIYRRVIGQFGDIVCALPKDDPAGDPTGNSELSVDVRQYCQRRIAAMPPEGREIYRARVDAQAEGWYRKGAAERDRGLLRRVVEQAFCSSWGDDALDLLGDLAFQDGRFAEALSTYRRIVPDRPGEPLGLVHPDPDVDLARVAAKKLLCRAALGDAPPTAADLEAFAAAYPQAKGRLAGRDGLLSKDVSEAIASDHLAAPVQLDGRWPTFGGAPSRSKVAPGTIDIGSFQWRLKLEPITNGSARQPNNNPFGNQRFGQPPAATTGEPILAYHPIVLNDQVVVGDDHQIAAYNLNARPEGKDGTVELAWKHDENQNSERPARAPQGSARYTLTASGDRIYSRTGAAGANAAMNRMNGMQVPTPPSYIVAVERSTEGKVLWRRSSVDVDLPRRGGGAAVEAAPAQASFEGTPVADGRGVYAAMTVGGAMTACYVVALDAETGATLWARHIGDSNAPNGNNMNMGFGGMPTSGGDIGNRLLSLDGPTVYYQTNVGAVAALDAETGAIRWLASYGQQDRPAGGRDRDPNPAIVHEGRVIVAPDDSQAIFAFDAVTGKLVWRTGPMPDVTHLLGVAKGRLIATGNHVWSIDAASGKVLRCWPEDQRGYDGYGRGILAGDQIYWPTKTEIHVLDQASGLRGDRPPIKLQETFQTGGGNLAVGDGYLIVAQADALVVFCQNSRLIERFREEIAREPNRASTYYRLAQVAEATGDEVLALESLAMASSKASASEVLDGVPLADAARGHQHRLLMKLGAKAAAAKDWAEAVRRFAAASEAAASDRDRLAARLRLSESQASRGDAKAAVATLQGILANERLRLLAVSSDEHRTVRADLIIADRLAALIRDGGRAVYADYDRRAAELLGRGQAEKDPRLLEEVGRSYPVAESAPEALLALGKLGEASGRAAEAAHAYKRLMLGANDDATRARALLGLARAYEMQHLWGPARDAYLQARSRFAAVDLKGEDGTRKVGALADAALGRPPFDRLVAEGAEPDLPVPLSRRWVRHWPGPARPLMAEGIPPSPEAARIFLATRQGIRPIDPATGEPTWTADLGGEPIWVGYLADHILAATATRITALNLEKGGAAWHYDLGAPGEGRAATNPFAKVEPADERKDGPPPRLHDFRIVGGRVFCRRGDRELLAFDGDTGLLDWSFAPASGRLGPHLWIGPDRIALQVRKPNALLVLETATGRRKAEAAQPSEAEEWAREPLPLDDDHVAIVADRRTVVSMDLNRAAVAWSFRESSALPTNGPPRVLGDPERLLVLHNGNKLIRLDSKGGDKVWARPLGSEDLSERPEAMALDGDRFYWVSGSSGGDVKATAHLEAVALADGSTLWERFLAGPATGWGLSLARRCVAAYPVPSRSLDGDLDGLPLVFCRRDTGALVQRVLLPSAVSELAVRLAPRGAFVATQDTLWSLGDRRPMDATRPPR